MKKLLSLILALITVMSVATVMTGAAETDVAQTSETYYISNTAYEKIDASTGKFYGYLGDVDSSTDVTILDATEIQLSIARLTTFSDKQKNLGDVDRDGNVSILDATSIQCFIARIPTDAQVAHTLYTKNSAPSGDIYEQVKSYIKANGYYYADSNWYCVYDSSTDIDTGLTYMVDQNELAVSINYYSDSTSISLFFIVKIDKADEYDYNSFNANKMIGAEQIYDAFGKVDQLKSTDRKLSLENYYFATEKNITFESVEPEIQNLITKGFAKIENQSNGKITNLYQIFG